MTTQLNRRRLLKTGSLALIGAASQTFTGIPALAGYAVGPAVRRNAFHMAASDPLLVGARRGIRARSGVAPDAPCRWA